ncbi:hypothetical protein WR25_07993 [Diploscapter pachys]|uniref:SSD domain-containing protein n=1 Tax=Diploscapter pachys TaxID=2018661 RepID=A0A2A2JQ13_9BILA|nr:hypothetical protein WR25_07993 [Diploscapter pachys]
MMTMVSAQSRIEKISAMFVKCTIHFRKALHMSPVCSYETVMQAMHYLMPKQWNEKEKMFTVVLKVAMFHGSNRAFYDALAIRLIDHIENSSFNLKLKGIAFNLKEKIFLDVLISDSKYALISGILVFGCFLIYAQSIFFTAMVLTTVVLSIGLGFYIYSVALGIDFFPFINLLVLVLLIAIGADDAFVLSVYFRSEKKKLSYLSYEVGNPYLPTYKEADALRAALRNSLHHSLLSMFITSATTAIAFLTNLTSSIIVLR